MNWSNASRTFLLVGGRLSLVKTSKLIYKSVQKEAVAKGILHHDVSPFNVLIDDSANEFQGMLIDWEFAVEITVRQKYSVGGTMSSFFFLGGGITITDLIQGTILFLSMHLLGQISDDLKKNPLKNRSAYKEDDATSVQLHVHADDDFAVEHVPADDIESLFYIFIWILVLYNRPLGWEREGFDFESSILAQWSEHTIYNLKVVKNAKIAFISSPNGKALADNISPYFEDLLPLAENWQQIFRTKWNAEKRVDFDSLLQITNQFLETMTPEDLPDVTNECLSMEAEKEALCLPLPSPPVKVDMVSGKKWVRDDNIRSMGDVPLSVVHKRPKGS